MFRAGARLPRVDLYNRVCISFPRCFSVQSEQIDPAPGNILSLKGDFFYIVFSGRTEMWFPLFIS